ncbi:MAG: phosphate acyltransferase PlsX [Firmicutes bacterium]|jgi:glycerol-3-phosphate acyltransferase PlsX|nr:phosphate acyltransferase PlsX [Bacillota bacterium]MDH7494901.1 phosphate acyltransferase PlsX [Bacillota bacterium]
MRIALDAMGGDFAPDETVAGAVLASKELDVDVVLVGDREAIERRLAALGGAKGSSISVVHAGGVISMDEHHPVEALRKTRDASVLVAADLVGRGEASAMVSAGNTGAAMVSAIMRQKRIRGVDRPAIATVFPTTVGYCLLIDAGANSECRPHHILTFAQMGAAYAKSVMGIPRPRVALLSNGEEETKGTELVVAAHALLSKADLGFVGNIEGKDIPFGRADVVVTDGFTGNVALKLAEGVGEAIVSMLKASINKSVVYKIGALLARPALKSLAKRMDYSEYGGALLLGVNGVTVIAHGRSKAKAIANAIRAAKSACDGGVVNSIAEMVSAGGYEGGNEVGS